MSTQTPPASVSLAPLGPMVWHQLKAELLRLWRTPSFLVSSLLLPAILFSLLGLRRAVVIDGVSTHVYILASVATYGIVSVMLYSFGVSIANERAQRVNVLMRATPLPAYVYLLAKVVTALLSAVAMLLVLSFFAFVAGGVQLSAMTWITLITSVVLGALPFVALGFAIGNVINPTGVGPIINVSFFVLSFASGIFVPLSQLPDVLQNIAPYSPFYLLGQLAWHAVGAQSGSIGNAVWLLALYGIIFFGLAVFAFRREEQHTFG